MFGDYKKRLRNDEKLREEVCSRFEPQYFKGLSDADLRKEYKKHRKSLDDVYPPDKQWKDNPGILSTIFGVLDTIMDECSSRGKLDDIVNREDD